MPHSPASDSERMYACQHCPKRYARKDYLERHELNHTRPQSVCPACGKGFARPDVLRKHLSTSCKSRRGSDGDAPAPLTTAEEDALVPRKRRRPQRRLTNASSPSSDEEYNTRPSKRRTQSYETYPALERLNRLARSPHYAETVRGLMPSDSESEHELEHPSASTSASASASASTHSTTPLSLAPVFAATPETLSLFKADPSLPEWRAPDAAVVVPVPEPEGDDLFSWLFQEPEKQEVKVDTEPPYESYLHAWEQVRTRPPSSGRGVAPPQAFRPDPWEDWRMAQGGEARDEVLKMFGRSGFGNLEALRAR